jgi:type II secretory pathway pseudopilin PulG
MFNEIEIGPVAGGFSLVEAALSLAIISFAIIAIMGLFPVAMQTARESNRETRATLIARRIVDELQSLPATNTALVRGPSVTNAGWRITGLDLSRPSLRVLTYDEQGEGLTSDIAPGAFQNPIPAQAAYFAAEIRVTPDFPYRGISRVQATVEAPAGAPSSKRSRFVFVTLMGQH